ncbi:hypothetical protein [Haloarcula sp. H-GB5]
MTPQDADHAVVGSDEGDTTPDGTTATTGRVWPSHSHEDAAVSEMVILPSRAPREDKYHRPGAPGLPLPACGTFDSTGVAADRDELRERGYRPCRLCWPDAAVDGEGGERP